MLKTILFLAAALVLAAPGHAEVYLSVPKSQPGALLLPSSLPSILNAETVLNEPISINGISSSLKVGLINGVTLSGQLRRLLRSFPSATVYANAESARISINADKRSFRLFLLQLSPASPVIQFSIELPDKMPSIFTWPRELPLPHSATPVRHIRLPGRKADYGQFHSTLPPEQAMQEMIGQATAAGWESAPGQDHARLSGRVLIRKSPLSIMMLSVNKSTGAIYTRPLDP